MTETTSWFDDDALLEAELQTTLAASTGTPTIPGYTQLRELARGGQGVVYSGLQQSTRRIVAIKVLREGPADGLRGVRRFEREVDLAASLAHPNVVSLFDSGTTPDGRPFLVMELIDGPSIDHAPQLTAMREHALARPWLDELLRLFLQVCDGVAYAHRRGIVHRDLKPSNIRIDANGRARVLDFGLAKHLVGSPTDLTLTLGGPGSTFVGSLPWASPEQALGRNDEIDVRSDVYALGVILHQLLSARFPYDVESDLRAALDAIVHTAPEPLRRIVRVPEDLETITLRCLQKDADRRYQSVTDLAHDLRAFLAGDAIEARRDSTWYVLRKTARRHRVAVVAGAMVAISLVLGLAVSLWFWRQADADRSLAVASATRAQSAMDFFVDTVLTIDPDQDGPDLKLIEVVERAAKELPTRFPDDADSKSFFLIKLIDLFRNLDRLDEAERLAREAITVAVGQWGDTHTNTRFAQANLATIQHLRGKSLEALPELEAIVARIRAEPPPHELGSQHVFNVFGLCLLAAGRIDDAERAFRDAAAIPVSELAAQHLRVSSQENLASIAGHRGDSQEAIRLMREVVAARERNAGPEHTRTIGSIGNLAYYLAQAGEIMEAEQLTRRLLDVCRRKLPPRALETLSMLNNHGNYLERLGRLDEAEAAYRECLEGRVAVLGEDHPHTLITFGNLASLAITRGNLAIAERDLRRILEIRTTKFGARDLDTLIAKNNLGKVLHELGRTDDAIALQREVVADTDAGLGAEFWAGAQFRGNLGAWLMAQGKHAEAEPILRAGLAVLEQKFGKAHDTTAGVRARLLELLRATDRAAEAEAVEAAGK